MSTGEKKIFVNDPIEMAEQNRHHAVHTAMAHLHSGGAHVDPHLRALHFEMALDVLIKSVQKCSLLDNRPLDPARVHNRHLASLARLYAAETAGEVA